MKNISFIEEVIQEHIRREKELGRILNFTLSTDENTYREIYRELVQSMMTISMYQFQIGVGNTIHVLSQTGISIVISLKKK